jgi:drug/metabolite transporter (DMT)-like permease
MNILYSLNQVLIKIVSVKWETIGLFAFPTLAFLFIAIVILGLYAVLWQQILSKVDLTVAYMCKGMIVFWGILWALLIFKEQITIFNITGTVLIFLGTYVMTANE